MNKEFQNRIDTSAKLEKACSKLLRTATKTWRASQMKIHKAEYKAHKAEHKAAKKAAKKSSKHQDDIEKQQQSTGASKEDPVEPLQKDFKFDKPPPTMEGLLSLVPREKWPHHKLGTIPFTGQKVETISWCKDEIARLNAHIPVLRAKYLSEGGQGKPLGSVFVECNNQLGAHVLAQCVSYHEPLKMTDKWVDVHSRDILWSNIDDGALEVRGRYVLSWILTFGLIILWAFPVSFIGLLSNLGGLCEKVPWLAWVCKAPQSAQGILQGLLPPVLMAVLFILLPIILRRFAVLECIPRSSLVDISVYKRYFIFLIIHGFLVVTLSSSLTKTIPLIISQPTKAVPLLAQNLPTAAIFFLTYMVTQGFTGAASALLQIAPLVLHYVKKRFFGQTPRQAFAVTFIMPAANFGLILPRLSLLATIGIAYSILSPIINGLACVTFLFYFLAWKFLLLYVFDQPDEVETGGMYFPLVISNLFTGLYIEHLVLAILLFLKASIGLIYILQGVLMLVLAAITLSVHLLINKSVEPVTKYLPVSLGTKKLQERYGHGEKKHHGHHHHHVETEEEKNDIFRRNRVQSTIHRRVKKVEQTIEKKILKVTPAEDANAQKKEKGEEKAVAIASGSALSGPGNPETLQEKPTTVQQPNGNGVAEATSPASTAVEKQPELPRVDTGFTTYLVAAENQAALERSDTVKSNNSSKKSSKSSKKSNKSSKKKEEEELELAPPQSALIDSEDSDDNEEYLEEHAFDHPATYAEARWIWIPCDELGFSKVLLGELKKETGEYKGIEASDVGSTMDAKGIVEVNRNPPDEDWSGGFDR